MQREEKVMEAATEAIAQRIAELKNAINQCIFRLEHEQDTLRWPQLLDNFGLLTGELNSLLKTIKNEKTPALRNYVVLPLLLNQEKDDALMQQTEGRIPFFNHEIVPHALRTKPEPAVEQFQQQLENKMLQSNADLMQKHINTLNKICGHVLDSINNHTQDRESGIPAPAQTSNMNDTHLLVAAVSGGRGLKPNQMQPSPMDPNLGPPRPGPPGQQQGGPGVGPRAMGMMGPGQGPMGKMPNIRTNIRVANAPYNR